MKPGAQFLPTRSSVVFHHTRRMIHETSLCVRKFAMDVAEAYLASVAIDHRQVPFRDIGRFGASVTDLVKVERHNGQIVSRYLDGTVKTFPADLEDAWVRCMRTPYREELEADLADRRGNLAVKHLVSEEVSEAVGVGHLMKEFGELVEALAPALADGRITDADLPHVKRILHESDGLIAAVLSIRHQVIGLLPGGPPT